MPAHDEDPYSVDLPENWGHRIRSESDEDDLIWYLPNEGEYAEEYIVVLEEDTSHHVQFWWVSMKDIGEEWEDKKTHRIKNPEYDNPHDAAKRVEEIARSIEAGDWD